MCDHVSWKIYVLYCSLVAPFSEVVEDSIEVLVVAVAY